MRQAGTRWSSGTSKVTKEVRYEKSHLLLASFQDPSNRREYIQGPPSEIFRLDLNGHLLTSESQPWTLEGIETELLSQGELLFKITVRDNNLRIGKNYLVYPEESIIQEWTSIENISGRDLTLADPYFLQIHILQNQVSQLEFSYMTGECAFGEVGF